MMLTTNTLETLQDLTHGAFGAAFTAAMSGMVTLAVGAALLLMSAWAAAGIMKSAR